MFKKESVYSILKLQLFIAKIFGLAPYNISNNGPEESKLALFWTILLMLIIAYLSLFALISRGHKEYGLIMRLGDALSIYLNVISMCSVLIYSCVYRKTMMEEIKKLFYIDRDLQKFNFIANIHKSYNKSKTWVIFGTCLLMTYLTAILIVNIVTYGSKTSAVFIGNVIAYIFPSIINTMMELQFCTMVLLLRRRFCWLNSKILEIGEILKTPKLFTKDDPLKEINHKIGNKHTQQDQISLLLGQAKVTHQQLCTISKQINKAFSVQILLLIVTTFLNSVMTLFYWAIRSTLSIKDEISYAEKVFRSNGFGLAIIEIIFIVFVCSATASEIMSCIKEISRVDKEVFNIGVGVNRERLYTKSRKWIIFTNFVTTIYLLTLIFLDGISYYTKMSLQFMSEVVVYSSPMLIKPIMELQFCTFVMLLWQRFFWLNFEILEIGKYLKQPTISKDMDDYKYRGKNIGRYDDVISVMRKIKVSHSQLCSIAREINKAFSIQILLLVLTSFLIIVMTVFYWALESDENAPKTFIYYSYGVLFLSIAEVIALTVCCSLTVEEAKRSGSLIHDIMPPTEVLPNKRALQLQLSSFSLQLAQYNVEFNACGVFPINETLIYSIVGAASAYLVIVIQFELSNRTGNHTVYNST